MFFTAFATVLALSQGANAAFGLTSTSSRFTVDTDGGLVFEVNRYSALHGRLNAALYLHILQIEWRYH